MALYVDSAFLHDIMNVAQTIPHWQLRYLRKIGKR